MSYRRFTGWEPAERHEVERDADGRVVAVTVEREPEWDEQERAWALALAQFEASLCPNCGRPLSLCSAPESEGRWSVGPPSRCHATTAVLSAQKPYQGDKVRYPGALMFSAVYQPASSGQ